MVMAGGGVGGVSPWRREASSRGGRHDKGNGSSWQGGRVTMGVGAGSLWQALLWQGGVAMPRRLGPSPWLAAKALRNALAAPSAAPLASQAGAPPACSRPHHPWPGRDALGRGAKRPGDRQNRHDGRARGTRAGGDKRPLRAVVSPSRRRGLVSGVGRRRRGPWRESRRRVPGGSSAGSSRRRLGARCCVCAAVVCLCRCGASRVAECFNAHVLCLLPCSQPCVRVMLCLWAACHV